MDRGHHDQLKPIHVQGGRAAATPLEPIVWLAEYATGQVCAH